MRQEPEPERFAERFVDFSDRIILGCEECGERMVLLGREEDWLSERTKFECECGEELTLANRAEEEALLVKELLRTNGISGP